MRMNECSLTWQRQNARLLFPFALCFCLSSLSYWFLACSLYFCGYFGASATYFEHFCSTRCTDTANGLSSVLHRYLLVIFHVSFGFTFYAISLYYQFVMISLA